MGRHQGGAQGGRGAGLSWWGEGNAEGVGTGQQSPAPGIQTASLGPPASSPGPLCCPAPPLASFSCSYPPSVFAFQGLCLLRTSSLFHGSVLIGQGQLTSEPGEQSQRPCRSLACPHRTHPRCVLPRGPVPLSTCALRPTAAPRRQGRTTVPPGAGTAPGHTTQVLRRHPLTLESQRGTTEASERVLGPAPDRAVRTGLWLARVRANLTIVSPGTHAPSPASVRTRERAPW